MPRSGQRRAHKCFIRHCGKLHSQAKPLNKHIMVLSKCPSAMKTMPPYKPEHIFQAAHNSNTHTELPQQHQKRYQIPRAGARQGRHRYRWHCGKLHSQAKQPNKYIVVLSRRMPAVKIMLQYNRTHVFQAAHNSSTHFQRHPS